MTKLHDDVALLLSRSAKARKASIALIVLLEVRTVNVEVFLRNDSQTPALSVPVARLVVGPWSDLGHSSGMPRTKNVGFESVGKDGFSVQKKNTGHCEASVHLSRAITPLVGGERCRETMGIHIGKVFLNLPLSVSGVSHK